MLESPVEWSLVVAIHKKAGSQDDGHGTLFSFWGVHFNAVNITIIVIHVDGIGTKPSSTGGNNQSISNVRCTAFA